MNKFEENEGDRRQKDEKCYYISICQSSDALYSVRDEIYTSSDRSKGETEEQGHLP